MTQESRNEWQAAHESPWPNGQHTEGPWTAVNDTLIHGPHGEAVAVTNARDIYPFDPNHAANAHLIAAAPDLLAALEALTVEAETWSRSGAVREARDAIRKARGED